MHTEGTMPLWVVLCLMTIAMNKSRSLNNAISITDDPYLWLEDVQGKRALEWVREQNGTSSAVLKSHPDFEASKQRIRAQLDSPHQIPYAYREGEYFINFWRDEVNPRGLWRRTPLSEYRKGNPSWEVLLDLDALAESEDENWVWQGEQSLGGSSTRSLISLSRGGADAVVVREFDTATKRFVEDGFVLYEAKSSVAWLDRDSVFVGTDFGPDSVTESGYPRMVKLWQRGQNLSDAELVFEGETSDVNVSTYVDHTHGFERVSFERSDSFYSSQLYLWGKDCKLQKVPKPNDAELHFWREHVLILLRSDWTVQDLQGTRVWPAGSLLVGNAAAFLQGDQTFNALFTPTPRTSLADYSLTYSHILLSVLDNVAGRAEAWYRQDSTWVKHDIAAPSLGTLHISSLHDPQLVNDPWAEHFFLNYCDFVTPDSLYLGEVCSGTLECIKTSPAFFDATNIHAEQRFATSKDGTQVPYFVVGARDRSDDGKNPTLLSGYGGFEVSEQPRYAAEWGSEWIAKGGVLVVANIRGGGEFGPAWHQAAIGVDKQKSYDDFVAVAEDLVSQRVTSSRHLGIQGGSNGGLLVGAVMLQRPDLFNAVVCQVPLLDMRRYHILLAGASWVAEYGDPDVPENWAHISQYSPYHNVRKDHVYPPVFFVTSTLDDRVHPAHARKMAARMLEQGHAVLYHETIEGGHSAGADNNQAADRTAMEFAFLWAQLARP